MAAPVLTEVDHATISPVCLADPATQAVIGFWDSNKMNVVRHKAVRPDIYATFPAPFTEQSDICSVIPIIEECWHSSVAPLRNMMGNSRCYDACNSGHGGKLVMVNALVNR